MLERLRPGSGDMRSGGEGGRLMWLTLWASVISSSPGWAQGLPSWADELFGMGRGRIEPRREFEVPRRREFEAPQRNERLEFEAPQRNEPRREPERNARSGTGGDVRDGGPRPVITPVAPATVAFDYEFPAQSIVIDTGARALYYVLPDRRAYRYS